MAKHTKNYIFCEYWQGLKVKTIRHTNDFKILCKWAKELRDREIKNPRGERFLDPIECRCYRAYEVFSNKPPKDLNKEIVKVIGIPKDAIII